MINKKIIFLPAIALIAASCSSGTNSGTTGSNIGSMVNQVKIEKKAESPKVYPDNGIGYSIQVKISRPPEKGLRTKSAANVSGYVGNSFTDIRSFSAFLTTNYNDPFAAGANPKGDGVMVNVDITTTGTATINFNNIPPGATYYAAVAAFDDVLANVTRNNITLSDATICNNPSVSCSSSDKSWARTNNNVTISSNGTFSFSNGASELDVDLNLLGGQPASLSSDVSLISGNVNLSTVQGAGQN
jgi:hypothetical protein